MYNIATFTYRGLGRLARIDYPAPDADVVYQCDAAGQRTDLQDGVGLTHWSYDDLGQALTVTDPFSTMTRN